MIYLRPPPEAPIDQGDLIDECPLVYVASFMAGQPEGLEICHVFQRVIVLTQTCDLNNQKTNHVVVAPVFAAADLVQLGAIKTADVKGPIRAGLWLVFLPKATEIGVPESIIDLRQPYTIERSVLSVLCKGGKRLAHLPALYREHLAQHFALTFSRIGLPAPYETD